MIDGGEELFQIEKHFLTADTQAECEVTDKVKTAGNQRQLHGIVVGGNIRCFLKLAGTEYMPDLTDKILLLESYSGTAARMETYLCQLEQLGAFRKAAGILLGTFTEMQKRRCEPSVGTLVRRYAGADMPIAVTGQVGHGTDAKGIWIGKEFMM